MPYSEKEIADFWESIDKAAEDAAPAPYSHSKVKELIRVCWALKKENTALRAEVEQARAEAEAADALSIKKQEETEHYWKETCQQRTTIERLKGALENLLETLPEPLLTRARSEQIKECRAALAQAKDGLGEAKSPTEP